ncbi:VTT domain-containing protein [Loktanella sp. SALINAS62]|uniref:TVP38/TMEM64 family protein n=1 Tax=Loktanella sp. SALINAS62 TaxID=2706124 RepID=UPI001B8B8E76|nr:VTT domain-containing protein [Loktanella sp. SALINAS62]MBS1301465.1 TVP38/TMEM64 family protein [Loktanella sp. SALINAS62]
MSDRAESRANPILRRLPLIGIVVVAILGFWFLRDFLTFDALRQNREALIAFRDANYLLCVVGFIAAYAAIVAFSLPGGTIATLTGGFLFASFPDAFPVLPAALYNVTGATLGAVGLFLAARWGLGETLSRKMDAGEGLVKRIKDGIDENQWSMLFLIRLVPAVPFFVANLVPALVGVPLFRYAVSTFFGIMPGTIVFTSVGAGLSQVFDSGESPDMSIIFEPSILFPIAGLCLMAALPIILKAVRGKKGV